jgi:hypothetical protein
LQNQKSDDTNKSTMKRSDANLVLRSFSIELLRQIMLADPELIASCDGTFQILWDAVLQFEHRKLQCPLLLTILHTVGSSEGDFEIPPLRSMLWPLTTVESPKTRVQIERARVMSSSAVRGVRARSARCQLFHFQSAHPNQNNIICIAHS